jgi:hypothetical protein
MKTDYLSPTETHDDASRAHNADMANQKRKAEKFMGIMAALGAMSLTNWIPTPADQNGIAKMSQPANVGRYHWRCSSFSSARRLADSAPHMRLLSDTKIGSPDTPGLCFLRLPARQANST